VTTSQFHLETTSIKNQIVKELTLDPDSIHKTIEITGIEFLVKKTEKIMKDKIEKKINSIIETNDLTDMQVWGVWCGIGFISAFIIMWII